MTIYGYARVSTEDQSLDIQLADLKREGCQKIFSEKETGIKDDRKELTKLLKVLKRDDTLIVPAVDRLGRSMQMTVNVLCDLTKAGIKIKSIKEPMLDTTSPYGDILIAIFAAFAAMDRKRILERTSAGRKRAMERGVKMGRKSKLTPFQKREALERFKNGETKIDIGRSYNVSHTCICRLVNKNLVQALP